MDPREQIKAKIDLVPFIAEHIPLKQMGRNFKALCPFHGEKTPSFVVSPERQIWHCFGCQKGGDCFTFLMEFEKMDFLEALRTLAKRTGVKLTTLPPTQSDQLKERLFAINHLSSEFYHYILTSHKAGKRALDYLRDRGIKRQTIDTFQLGFAPAKWDLLHDFLTKKKGFSESDIEAAGLIIATKNNELITKNRYYDRFRSRIMFTLRDHRSNVVGFAGRLLDPQAKEAHSPPVFDPEAQTRRAGGSVQAHSTNSVQAKYVNTPETPLYHKGELFYGLDITKEDIKKENQAIIVEGEFDLLQSFQEGVGNIVALKGTALTIAQAKLIRRFTQNIALAFDLDVAGDAAARRGIEVGENEGLNIKVIQVKGAKDPDEMIRKNPIAWKKVIKEAESVYDFLIDSALSRYDPKTVEGEKGITNDVLPPLSTIGNEIVKAHFIKRLARELDVTEEVVFKQMEKLVREKGSLTSQRGTGKLDDRRESPLVRSRQEVLEEYFLALVLQKGDHTLLQKMEGVAKEGLIQNPAREKILATVLTFYKRKTPFTISSFVKGLPVELLPTVDRLYLLDTESVGSSYVAVELERAVRELRIVSLRKQMADIANTLREQERAGDNKAIASLKKTFDSLSNKLNDLTSREITESVVQLS